MSSYNLGKVCLTPRGSYSAAAHYEKLDTVSCAGGSFICLKACTGIDPVSDPQSESYWSCCSAGIAGVSAEYSGGRVYLTVVLTDGRSCSIDFPVTEIPDLSVSTQKLALGAVTAAKIASGAVTAAKLSGPVPLEKGGTGASDGAEGLAALFAAGPSVLSPYQYGPSLPSSGTEGQLFFLTGEE